MLPRLFPVFVALFLARAAFAAAPSINYTMPGAVVPGKATELTIEGENLSGATWLWENLHAGVRFVTTNEPGKVICALRLEAGVSTAAGAKPAPIPSPSIGAIRLATTNGISGLHLLMIDHLPSIAESGTNKSIASAQALKLPVAVDGSCGEQSYDYFRFHARKGERVCIEVVAHRLGSALDPVLRVLDTNGRELAYCDDDPSAGNDSRIAFKAPATGDYLIELRDIGYQGGPKFRYRLRVGDFALAGIPVLPVELATCALPAALEARTELEPNDATNRATKISPPVKLIGSFAKPNDRDFYEFTVEKDQRLIFTARTRSLGFPCDLSMRLLKLDGTHIAETKNSDADEGAITNKFGEAATYRLLVEEMSRQSGMPYQIEITPFAPGFTLSVETDRVDAANGGTFGIKVTCARREYDGPITLALDGIGDGFALEENVIPEKKSETTLKAKLPSQFTPGQMFHFRIVGRGRIGESEATALASTKPALRKLFPQMLHPPPELDGLLGLGIRPPAN